MMTQAETTAYYSAYAEGYKSGHADRLLGARSVIALTSPIPGYAAGYTRGWDEGAPLEGGS